MTMFLAGGAAAMLFLSGCSSSSDQSANAALVERTATGARSALWSTPSSQLTDEAPSATAADRHFARQLGTLLVGHATLDGVAVTAVRAIDKCHTTFVTAKGDTMIDWTRAGNLAPHDEGGREINRLPSAAGWHDMSVPLGELPEPAGNVADRSSGAFGQLATECA